MNNMIRMPRFSALSMTLGLLLCIQHYSYAGTHENKRCDANITEVVFKHFNIPSDGEIRDSACKIWPYDKNKILAAVAYAPSGYDFAVSDYPLSVYIAVIDAKANTIVATHQGGILEDGTTQITEFTLGWDTARYDMADGVRGFALRVNAFRESPAMNGGFDNQLTLFIIDGKTVRPVIRELNMREWECDIGCGEGNAKRIETTVAISMAKEKTNGFADTILTASKSDSGNVVTYRAKYNGSQYDLSGWRETQHLHSQ